MSTTTAVESVELTDRVRAALDKVVRMLAPEVDGYSMDADEMRAAAETFSRVAVLRAIVDDSETGECPLDLLDPYRDQIRDQRDEVVVMLGRDTAHRQLASEGDEGHWFVGYKTLEDILAQYDRQIANGLEEAIGLDVIVHALGARARRSAEAAA